MPEVAANSARLGFTTLDAVRTEKGESRRRTLN